MRISLLLHGVLVAVAVGLASCTRSSPVATPPAAEETRLAAEFRSLVDGYNRETGARQLAVEEVRARLERGDALLFIDTREPEEHEVGALPGALLVPPDQVARATVDVPEGDVTIVTYCTAGYRSGHAAVALEERLGRPVFNLDGGIIEWFNAGAPVHDPQGRPVERIHPYSDDWGKFVRRPSRAAAAADAPSGVGGGKN